MKSHFFRRHAYIEIAVGRIACGEPVSTRLECHICLISIQTSGTSMFEQTEVYQNRFRMTNQPDVEQTEKQNAGRCDEKCARITGTELSRYQSVDPVPERRRWRDHCRVKILRRREIQSRRTRGIRSHPDNRGKMAERRRHAT